MHLMTYKKGALPGLPLISIYHKFPVGSMTARRWVQRNGYAGACQGLPVGHSIGWPSDTCSILKSCNLSANFAHATLEIHELSWIWNLLHFFSYTMRHRCFSASKGRLLIMRCAERRRLWYPKRSNLAGMKLRLYTCLNFQQQSIQNFLGEMDGFHASKKWSAAPKSPRQRRPMVNTTLDKLGLASCCEPQSPGSGPQAAARPISR